MAFDQFKDTLKNSENPLFITIGSQWSNKTGCTELLPYIASKHALNLFTRQKAIMNPLLKISNYCVPTMETPAYRRVKESFSKVYHSNDQNAFSKELADASVVAKHLVAHLHDGQHTSGIYSISATGHIRKI